MYNASSITNESNYIEEILINKIFGIRSTKQEDAILAGLDDPIAIIDC